ncbi:unnamed protein product [Anisakis simplex]|uniref:DB domain-containing protein n=1 Tax=Anisakis simplex TaxID=6269 RepID=A0A158PMV4_ANISI|nr:unnamed protein product [Anisakis simplex]
MEWTDEHRTFVAQMFFKKQESVIVTQHLPSCERAKCHHCQVDFIAKMCPRTCQPCPKPIVKTHSNKFANAKRIALAASVRSELNVDEKVQVSSQQQQHATNAVPQQPLSLSQAKTKSTFTTNNNPINKQLYQEQSQPNQRRSVTTTTPRSIYTPSASNTTELASHASSAAQKQHNNQSSLPTIDPRNQSPSKAQPRYKQQAAAIHQRNQQGQQLQSSPFIPNQYHYQSISSPYQNQNQLPNEPQPQFQAQQITAFPVYNQASLLQPQPQSLLFNNPFKAFFPQPQSFEDTLHRAVTPSPLFTPFTFPTFAPIPFLQVTAAPSPQKTALQLTQSQSASSFLPSPSSLQLPPFNQQVSAPHIPPPPPPPISLLNQFPFNQNQFLSSQSQPQQTFFSPQQIFQPQLPQPPIIQPPNQPAINQQIPQLVSSNSQTSQQQISVTQQTPSIAAVNVPQEIVSPSRIETNIDLSNINIEKTFYSTGKEKPIPITQCPRQPNWEPCIPKDLANQRFSSCCQRLGEGCAALCNYDATLTTIQLAVLTGRCPLSKVGDMMICASGYEDATPCCQAFNVFEPGFEHCRPYCNPAAGLPQGGLLSEQYKCLGKLSQIQRCFYISQRP